MKSSITLSFLGTRHQSHLVHLEQGLKKIRTAMIQNVLEWTETWVVEETSIVEVGLVNLDWASLVADHVFLEGEEANVPGISLSIGNELRHCRRVLNLWTTFKLPYASIDVGITGKRCPVLKMLWLISWEWHLSDVRDHIGIIDTIILKLGLVEGVK